MPSNLRSLANWFTEDDLPEASCTTCESGLLIVESIDTKNDGRSEALRDHENWEPDWITGTFSGFLKYNNPALRVLAGLGAE